MDELPGIPPVHRRENPYRNPQHGRKFPRKEKNEDQDDPDDSGKEQRKGPPPPEGPAKIDVIV